MTQNAKTNLSIVHQCFSREDEATQKLSWTLGNKQTNKQTKTPAI